MTLSFQELAVLFSNLTQRHIAISRASMGEARTLSLPRTARHAIIMSQGLEGMRLTETFVDVALVSQGVVLPCHRVILATYSPVLRAMLRLDTSESQRKEVHLEHIPPGVLTIILAYMYGTGVTLNSDQLMGTIDACDYLDLPELLELCVGEVAGALTVNNVLPWWKKAVMLELPEIERHCERLMASELCKVSQCADFLELTLDELVYCASVCSCHGAGEISLLKAAFRWVVRDVPGRITYVDKLLENVKLEGCPVPGLKGVIRDHQELLRRLPDLQKRIEDIMAEKSGVPKITSHQRLIIVGGQDSQEASAQCWEMQETNETHESSTQPFCEIPPGARSPKASVCTTPHGFAITGGLGSRSCWMFNAATLSWQQLRDLPCARYGHGTVFVGGALLAIGGIELGDFCSCTLSTVTSLAVGDVASGDNIDNHANWNEEPVLPLPVKYPKTAVTDDGEVYTLDAEDTNTLMVLRCEGKKTWVRRSPLPLDGPRVGLSMTSTGGRLFVAGGRARVFACYAPATDTWSLWSPPLKEHKYGALVCRGGKLLLLGGSFDGCSDEVEEYDLEAKAWSSSSYTMPRKLYHHQAIVLNM
jgi:kelch-like protein 24/35